MRKPYITEMFRALGSDLLKKRHIFHYKKLASNVLHEGRGLVRGREGKGMGGTAS